MAQRRWDRDETGRLASIDHSIVFLYTLFVSVTDTAQRRWIRDETGRLASMDIPTDTLKQTVVLCDQILLRAKDDHPLRSQSTDVFKICISTASGLFPLVPTLLVAIILAHFWINNGYVEDDIAPSLLASSLRPD